MLAHERFTQALRGAPVAVVASEEAEGMMLLNPGAPLAVAIDPLDGSSNIGVNMAVGSIFGIRPAVVRRRRSHRLLHRSRAPCRLAAGFVTYGPATSLVVTLGARHADLYPRPGDAAPSA